MWIVVTKKLLQNDEQYIIIFMGNLKNGVDKNMAVRYTQASKQASKQGITALFCHSLKLNITFVMDNCRILSGQSSLLRLYALSGSAVFI